MPEENNTPISSTTENQDAQEQPRKKRRYNYSSETKKKMKERERQRRRERYRWIRNWRRRKHKRHRKKKPKPKAPRTGWRWSYNIIYTNHGIQKKQLGRWRYEASAFKNFYRIAKENKEDVIFPQEYNNSGHTMVESDYELLLIKKKDSDLEKSSLVRNDYGELVEYELSNDNYIILERVKYYIEETFWVYGFHPTIQRKTFQWVFDHLIDKETGDKYQFTSVVIYHNKFLIETNGKLDMVMCKNHSDCVRMYNLTEEWCKKRKKKDIIFLGDLKYSKHKRDWLLKIQNLTHWNWVKIWRPNTRP